MQSLKKLFANNTAQPADSSRAAMHVEDEDIELDPEYAPKRALTTKVRQHYHCILKPRWHVLMCLQTLHLQRADECSKSYLHNPGC